MRCYAGIEAQLAWGLLFSGDEGVLGVPAAQEYAGIVEGLEAAELLKLITLARQRLAAIGEAAGSAAGAGIRGSRTASADQGLSASADQGQPAEVNQGWSVGAKHGQPASADNGQPQATRAGTVPSGAAPATELFIDKQYRIRLGSPQGTEIPFRPLVRALFVLFLLLSFLLTWAVKGLNELISKIPVVGALNALGGIVLGGGI